MNPTETKHTLDPNKWIDSYADYLFNYAVARVSNSDIAKDLVHPNIVQYKYFKREYDTATKYYSFHLLMELMEGEDMDVYLRE